MHTVESNFSNFVIKYLGKIKTEFENTSPCLSGAQMGSNHSVLSSCVQCFRSGWIGVFFADPVPDPDPDASINELVGAK